MRPVFVVLRKELLDGVRDRRSLLSLFLFPLVGPLMVSLILTLASEQAGKGNPLELPMVGRDNAPGLIAFLEGRNVKVVDPPADPVHAVQQRTVPLVLVVPDDYGKRFRQARPATVELIHNKFRSDKHAGSARRVRKLVGAYAGQVGTLRLLARGVSPELVQPVVVQEVDLSTPKSRAALFLGFIPMFVLLAAFIGGIYSATDATAGERERGSLEPLLLNPITRRKLVLGKWLATSVFSCLTVVLTLVCTVAALSRVSVDELGVSLSLAPKDAVLVLIVALPLALLASAGQVLVASFARSFREAQTYLSLMVFLPTLPAALVTVVPIKSQLWMMALPVFGQQVLLMDVIRGNPVSPLGIVVAALVALGGALACVHVTAALFRRERIIYGR
jgi:sodium transport system permease protein